MIIFLFFIIGIIVGSLLNVCIHRIPRGESIILPRSHCVYCNTTLPWYLNVPIVSFIALRGRCKFCGKNISPRYIAVEILSGVICALLFIKFGLTFEFLFFWYLSCALIVASFIDLKHHEIPDSITLPGILIGLISASLYPALMGKLSHLSAFKDSLLGIIAGGGSIYILGFIGEFIFKKEAMGGGDVKLLAMIGAFTGWQLALLTFFIAPFFGSIAGVLAKLKEGRDIIPYGPYLSLGAFTAIFAGEKILKGLFMF